MEEKINGVRFVNPQKQYSDMRDEILKTVDDVFSRGDLINRKDLTEFEEAVAEFVGVKYAIGVNSGTDALSLVMEAAGIGPGDEVITVGHTFMSSISAIYHQGAEAVLIDVKPDFNMDVSQLEAAITPKTKAIEPVHLNGRMSEMEAIMKIAEKHNLLVIEDAAQALGSKMQINGEWKMAGSIGLAGCFSMYPFKVLGGFGDGGMVTTNDEELAEGIRRLRYNGEDRSDRKFYNHGYTALLDNVQAALLHLKLKRFPGWLERRREIANLYYEGLKDLAQLKLPHFDDPRFYDIYQNYVIRTERRDELNAFLDKNNVETLISWALPMYKQPVMMPNQIHLPETEAICNEVISLPMFPELTNEEAQYVIDTIRHFFSL